MPEKNPMTLKRLDQLRYNRREVKQLEHELHQLRSAPEIVSDMVTRATPGAP